MRKTLPNLLNYCINTFILSLIHFCLIKCSYDVQYVVATYGFKINWIFIFVNHKWATHVLNALVLLFLYSIINIDLNVLCYFVSIEKMTKIYTNNKI
jgi:hypothetical protein